MCWAWRWKPGSNTPATASNRLSVYELLPSPESLLQRLDAIAASFASCPGALALVGLGSVGLERDRLDEYSDLDFFAIVQSGFKASFLNDLIWLIAIYPVTFWFQNTKDGCKLLYEDGIFCEFAVFEELELADIPFAPGRVVWKAKGIADSIAVPHKVLPSSSPRTTEWLVGEALTNLYVGLLRDRRGEHLTALRYIQGYAVDRILELIDMRGNGADKVDPFSPERRFEQRHPESASVLPALMQGYDRNRESALASLNYLEQLAGVQPAMKDIILRLCAPDNKSNL